MKKIRLLSGLTIALAPIATACSHKDVVVVYNPIPFTSEFYSMNDSGGNRVKINGFSEMVIDNPAILSKYNEIKITDYKTFKTIWLSDFNSLDFSKYQNISKITFNVSESIVVSCFAEAFDGFPLKEVDFGSGNVAANARSFATKTTGTIEKVTVSPNTRLSGVDVSVHDSPFAGQTTISTIDVSSFTTIDDVTDADWENDDNRNIKVWGNNTHAPSGKIIISSETLKSVWTAQFNTFGLNVDGTNWKFEVKK